MDHPVAGLVVDINDVRHGEDTGQCDLVGEGGDGDSLPRPRDEGGGAGWEVRTDESSPGDVPQEDGLQGHVVRQQSLEREREEFLLQTLTGHLESHRRDLIKCCVRWSEERDGPRLGEELHQACRPEEGDQGGELGVEHDQVEDRAERRAGA